METRKTDVMDGYTVVRLVKHAKDAGVEPVRKKEPEPPVAQPPAHSEPVRHIGKTVQPTKRTIRCYECSYEFQMAGRAQKTYCPKCRATLELVDYSIDGDWNDDLKTAGCIHIKPGGKVLGGRLIANNLILEGVVEEGQAEAYGTLELRDGAVFSEGQVRGRHLKVGPGAVIEFKQKAIFHDVVLQGELTAELEAKGLLEIKAGGHMKGRVHSRHLAVEEGGGLSARVFIWPHAGEAPE